MAVTVKQEVAALYSAIFNRAPDQAGLEFWVEAINGGDSLTKAAEGFTQHPVFAEVYGDLSNQAKVETLYTNVLGSAGDAAGIQFWVAKLESGVSFGQVVAEFVSGALTIDLDALLASGELSQADYDAAVVRQNSITNKADAGVYFADTFGAASNLSASTDTTTKEGLESDPVYLASQAAIAGVTNDAATLAAAKAAIDAAEVPTDLNVVPAPVFTLAEALAAETLPEGYVLSDATADLGALAIADVAAAQAAAADVVAGAANAAELELAATYTIADTLANVLAADAAVLADAASYSLTDAAGALGELTEAQIAVVQGAANVADYTYTVEFTLTAGLENLAAANAALDAFLLAYAQDPEVDGEEHAAVAGDVTDDQTLAINAVDNAILAVATRDAALDANGDSNNNDTDDFDFADNAYVNASAGVKAALLADAQAQLNARLAEAQADVAEAQADVDAVVGLNAAINAYATAQDVTVAAETAAADAAAALAGAISTFETREASANELVVDGSGQYFLDASGNDAAGAGDTAILTLDANGNLVVNPVWADVKANATLVPYANALLNAVNADAAAKVSVQNALEAEYQAMIARDFLDLTTGTVSATADLETVANAMVLTTLADGQMPTLKQIQTETTKLAGYLQTLTGQISSLQAGADAGASITAFNALTAAQVANKLLTAGDKTIIDKAFADTIDDNSALALTNAKLAAQGALDDNNNSLDLDTAVASLVDLTYADDGLGVAGVNEGSSAQNPLAGALSNAQALVTNEAESGWQDLIDALDVALANEAQAAADVATLQTLQADVNAALAAFDDNGFSAPETIDAANEYATPESDVFVVGTIAGNVSTIANFGTLGDDTIFVGTNYVLNTGDYATAGDNSAFEVFIYDKDGVATVAIEQEAFGSNSSDAETVITLTGLAAADITFADGYITLV